MNLAPLTPTQKIVVDWAVRGRSNKEIARITGIGDGTIGAHMKTILHKYNLRNRCELTYFVLTGERP